jgi:hypothetical protein
MKAILVRDVVALDATGKQTVRFTESVVVDITFPEMADAQEYGARGEWRIAVPSLVFAKPVKP